MGIAGSYLHAKEKVLRAARFNHMKWVWRLPEFECDSLKCIDLAMLHIVIDEAGRHSRSIQLL